MINILTSELCKKLMPNKKIVIITGGAGFIGSHTVDKFLENNYKVRVIDNLVGGSEKNLSHLKNNKDLSLEIKDIRNIDLGSSFFKDVDYLIHFAGIGDIVPSIENPLEYMSVNVLGTVNMLECSRNANIKNFVYAASSSCYGIAETPTKTSSQIKPQYPYALSKYQGEQTCFHWNKVYKLRVNSIRIFNAYGTRSKTSGAYGAVFGVFLKQKIANKPVTIVGDGSQKRDFLFVTDVANAFFKLGLSNLDRSIFNLGVGKPQSINYLVKLLKGDVVYIPKRSGEPDCTWADISEIKTN